MAPARRTRLEAGPGSPSSSSSRTPGTGTTTARFPTARRARRSPYPVTRASACSRRSISSGAGSPPCAKKGPCTRFKSSTWPPVSAPPRSQGTRAACTTCASRPIPRLTSARASGPSTSTAVRPPGSSPRQRMARRERGPSERTFATRAGNSSAPTTPSLSTRANATAPRGTRNARSSPRRWRGTAGFGSGTCRGAKGRGASPRRAPW